MLLVDMCEVVVGPETGNTESRLAIRHPWPLCCRFLAAEGLDSALPISGPCFVILLNLFKFLRKNYFPSLIFCASEYG